MRMRWTVWRRLAVRVLSIKGSYGSLIPRTLYRKMIILSTVVFLRLIVTGSGMVGSCSETGSAPRHVATHCIIESRESGICGLDWVDGVRVHVCDDRIRCPVWTGMPLDISCSDGDSGLTLYRGNSSLGSYVVSWPFAVSSNVEGIYECRWANGSLFANRSVNVNGKLINSTRLCIIFFSLVIQIRST